MIYLKSSRGQARRASHEQIPARFKFYRSIRQGFAGLVATQADINLIAEAANGLEAIRQFHRHPPDTTLVDLQMPETNGLDALIEIRGESLEACIAALEAASDASMVISDSSVTSHSSWADALAHLALLLIREVSCGHETCAV